jgi:trehalose 6-phosphate synthase/phosphatase
MECFVDKIQDIYTEGDVIMVHDYHLMMLPRLLRQRLPDAHIAFSMHTPCRCILEMPGRLGEFVEGIIGSNIITFLEPGDAMDFSNWYAQNYSKRLPRWATRAMPVGIDVSSIISAAQSEAVRERCESLRRAFKGRKIVFVYGMPDNEEEMEEVQYGYLRMLELAPWWGGSATIFLAVTCESRVHDPFEEEYSVIDKFVDTSEYVGLRWYKGCVSESDFHALIRCSDAAIFPFTPGGPMTAVLEYLVCHPPGNKRPIVSDINPMRYQVQGTVLYRRGDIDGIANVIDNVLNMPGGLWMEIPHPQDYAVSLFYTAKWWTRSILRFLMRALLRGHRPAGTFEPGVRSSRSPEVAGT